MKSSLLVVLNLFSAATFAGQFDMVSSSDKAIKDASSIIEVTIKKKDVVPKYKKVNGNSLLVSTEMQLSGSVKEVLLGAYKGTAFHGLFSWKNNEAPAPETETPKTSKKGAKKKKKLEKVILTEESGEEGSINEGEDWIVFLPTPPVVNKGWTLVMRTESAAAKSRILDLICKSPKNKKKLSKKQADACNPASK